MKADFCNNFKEFFEKVDPNKDQVAIFMHRDPDPDSIGAAFGVKWILRKLFSISSKIYYEGEITHRQNQTLLNVMNVILHKMEESVYDDYEYTILVDCVPGSSNSHVNKADIVIDHHHNDIPKSGLVFIDPVGSSSTLIYEMMEEFKLELNDVEDEQISTLLFFGIRVDTNELLSDGTTQRDWAAYKNLADLVDKKKISQILNYSYPSYYREIEKLTFIEENYKEYQGWFMCGLGYISTSRKDSLPTVAEKITRIEGYETAIIFAIIEDKLVASIRSINHSIDVNSLCKKIFGENNGGGRKGAGGAVVPLGMFSPSEADNETKELVWKCIRELCFQAINKAALGR